MSEPVSYEVSESFNQLTSQSFLGVKLKTIKSSRTVVYHLAITVSVALMQDMIIPFPVFSLFRQGRTVH